MYFKQTSACKISCWKQRGDISRSAVSSLRWGRISWKLSGIWFRSTTEKHPVNRCATCKLEMDAEKRQLHGDGPEPPRARSVPTRCFSRRSKGLTVTRSPEPHCNLGNNLEIRTAGWLDGLKTNVEMINVKYHPVVKAKKPGKCQCLLFCGKSALQSKVASSVWAEQRCGECRLARLTRNTTERFKQME